MDAGLIVRDATAGDLPAITALYGLNVETGAASFETGPPPVAEMAARQAAVTGLGLPWLVAEIDGAFAGYGYAGAFRPRPGYRFAVEDTVYVEPARRGRGVGKALLTALIDRCAAMGLRQMVAVIGDAANNAGSIALHRACGFAPVGELKGVGWKHDDWRDVLFMQRALGSGEGTPPDAPGLALDERYRALDERYRA